jgi:hypothetical protein
MEAGPTAASVVDSYNETPHHCAHVGFTWRRNQALGRVQAPAGAVCRKLS